MAHLPKDYEPTTIDNLVDFKFPGYVAWRTVQALLGNPKTFVAFSVSDDVVESYVAELQKLSSEAIHCLEIAGKEEKARRQNAEAALREANGFHNQPYAFANFTHWLSMSYWTPDEMTALSFGRNPNVVNWESVQPLLLKSSFAYRYVDRREIINRAITMGQLWEQTTPYNFIAWAKRMKIEVPQELIDMADELGLQVADWKAQYDIQVKTAGDILKHWEKSQTARTVEASNYQETHDELMQRMSELTESYARNIDILNKNIDVQARKIQELEGLQASESDLQQKAKLLNPRERESMLKLIIGMAIKKYSHKPDQIKNSSTANIARSLEEIGIPLDEDTIRKYLNEAKGLLNQN